jgi:hypothetical protein
MSAISLQDAMAFSRSMDIVRRLHPKFAREIDQLVFDVGQKYIECCGSDNCACQMDFETFHKMMNERNSKTVLSELEH